MVLLIFFRVLDRFVDATAIRESLLRNVVVVAGNDAVEAANRFRERYVFARRVREDLGDSERLREEWALDARCSIFMLAPMGPLVREGVNNPGPPSAPLGVPA